MMPYVFQNFVCLGPERDVYPRADRERFHVPGEGDPFGRHAHLLPPERRNRLRQACVAIPGLGGVGAIVAERLVRLGVGRLRIADGDTYNPSNLNRQFGSSVRNLGRRKADEIALLLSAINPDCAIEVINRFLLPSDASTFLGGVDVLVLCSDESTSANAMMKQAREMRLHVVTPRISGWKACCGLVSPWGENYLDYYRRYNIPPDTPTSFFTNASLGIPCTIAGSMAASFAVRVLLGDLQGLTLYPIVYEYDCWRLRVKTVDVFAKTDRLRKLIERIRRERWGGAERQINLHRACEELDLELNEDEVEYVSQYFGVEEA